MKKNFFIQNISAGFTLIETMVSLALVSLMVSCAFFLGADLLWISHETDYHNAVRLLKLNKGIIKGMTFDSLPPEVKTIPPSGIITLSNRFIVPESIVIIPPKDVEILPGDYDVNYDQGIVQFASGKFLGKNIIVIYSFYLPDSFEVTRVPKTSPYEVQLFNTPVRQVLRVELIQNSTKSILREDKYKWENESGKITFDSSLAGKVVQVSYLGKKIESVVSGKFLNPDNLEPAEDATSIKLIKIKEIYGGGGNKIEAMDMRFKR